MIEHVSAYGTAVLRPYITTTLDTVPVHHFRQGAEFPAGDTSFGAQVRLYTDPGTTIMIAGTRPGSGAVTTVVFAISGYLVDVPYARYRPRTDGRRSIIAPPQ